MSFARFKGVSPPLSKRKLGGLNCNKRVRETESIHVRFIVGATADCLSVHVVSNDGTLG